MVLGLSAKNKRGPSVHVDYLIHIQEIKPWPPSQSLRSLRSVLIQWENGERNSGSTNTVAPTIGSVIGEGKIEFNESFRLPVTLFRDASVKSKEAEVFHKNCLEFHLYEPRRDKTQLLATATIDLAEYGVVKESLSINAPMNSKRSFSNIAQPVLFIKIQPFNKGHTGSSSRRGLSKEVSMDKNGGESVSALMNEEYAEEAEVASFTDDDVSSHSSLNASSTFDSNGGLSAQNEENKLVMGINGDRGGNKENSLASKLGLESSNMVTEMATCDNQKKTSSCASSVDLNSELGSPVNAHASMSNSSNANSISVLTSVSAHIAPSCSLSSANENTDEGAHTNRRSNNNGDFLDEVHKEIFNDRLPNKVDDVQKIERSASKSLQLVEKLGFGNAGDSQVNGEESLETSDRKKEENGPERQKLDGELHYIEDEPVNVSDSSQNQVSLGIDMVAAGRGDVGVKGNILKNDRLRHVKSVRSSSDSTRNNGFVSNNQHLEVKEVSDSIDAHNDAGSLRSNERRDTKIYLRDSKSTILDTKVQQLESKIKILEGELREAAAIEASLYSVVAEHGSSMNKVHAPARRLSRLYLHTCRGDSRSRRAGAARSTVSGLVLVAKACGNDVPRLTFWLSNSVVLRAILSQVAGDPELPLSAGPYLRSSNGQKGGKKTSSPLRWKEASPCIKDNKNVVSGRFGEWEDPHMFISALEKFEAWIFSRIIESIWWQTLTPHMQSAAAKAINICTSSGSKKNYSRTPSLGDQDQGNFSLNLWKKAFKDACERLCPLRAGGHQCGCLPVLSRLIMEQCVARLDVAMFNAILRESGDEIPTDPVSDPISDSRVLPIPTGKSSFGAGAQLKNAIGNWSRWLTDLFGIDDDDDDDDDPLEDPDHEGDIGDREDTSFKSFHLLNAMSDLMMLPKDLLLSRSIRREVCPTFGTPLIKRILDSFIPDEFCPDPIPDVVLEALDSEDSEEAGEESLTNFPCNAPPPVYSPPSAASVATMIGYIGCQSQLRRSGSSVLRKSYTSDDELDELNSPLASIFIIDSAARSSSSSSSPVPTKPSWISKENGNQHAVRYELLRDVWFNSE